MDKYAIAHARQKSLRITSNILRFFTSPLQPVGYVVFMFTWSRFTVINTAMFVQEGDYVVMKKEANMKVFHVTLNRYIMYTLVSFSTFTLDRSVLGSYKHCIWDSVGNQWTRHTVNSSQGIFCDEFTVIFFASVTSSPSCFYFHPWRVHCDEFTAFIELHSLFVKSSKGANRQKRKTTKKQE